MKRHAFAAGILSAVILASCTKEVQTETPGSEEQSIAGNAAANEERISPGAYMPNEMLVKFKKGTSATARQQALERMGGRVKEHILTKAMERFGDDEGLYLVHTPLEVMNAVAQLRVFGEVEYAEPNYIYTHDATSGDTYFTGGQLWGMYGDASTPANQFGSQAAEAWAKGNTGSRSVIVGIIDEGVQIGHPDLNTNIWTNPHEPLDGTDNDGNGYVDDVNGWDFDGNNSSVYDGGSRGSTDKHGTHVAGTIGAEGSNTIIANSGVVGVNWQVTMISCKFLGRRGGTTANAIKAVDYLTDLKNRHGLNIVASNNSWGGGGRSQALYDAIQRANAKDILFIAAAGNGGSDGIGDDIDIYPSYPASYTNDNIIAVASITSLGNKSSFSNYGDITVDLGAPGSGIYSTLPPGTYGSYSGTSMATPHVTGGAALYAASNPGSTAAQIKAAILNNALPTNSMAGKTVTGDRLNVSGF